MVAARPGYDDCSGCAHEWEDPLNIVGLAGTAYADATKPIETFVLGLPGADTFDGAACVAAPYHMRLALSAIAAAGSPAHVPEECTGRTYTQGGPDPAVPCHTDLTPGGSYTVGKVATAIEMARRLVDELIFRDGFEGGDTLAWSLRATDGADLSVTPA